MSPTPFFSESTPLIINNNNNSSNNATTTTTIDDTDDELLQKQVQIIKSNMNKARRLLYISHFFAQFSEQVWQFALILFLAAFTNYESLILVSSYGFTTGIVVCLTGSTAGRYFVDRIDWNRLSAAKFLIWTENVCVVLATIFSYILLNNFDHADKEQIKLNFVVDNGKKSWIEREFHGVPLDNPLSILLLLGIHIFGPIAQILDKAFLVAIERDWVVVMGEVAESIGMIMIETSDEEDITPPKVHDISKSTSSWLSETNVFMRQIDLSCRVAAPAIAGFIIGIASASSSSSSSSGNDDQNSNTNLASAAFFVGFINIIALIVEYICTERIYTLIPELSYKHRNSLPPPVDGVLPYGTGLHAVVQTTIQNDNSKKTKSCCTCCKIPDGVDIYFKLPISWAGIGLSLLYLNALTFGGLMTAYLVWRGMRLETVGIWRGISSAAGLMGTFVYRYSSKRTTLVTTGMWSITYQFVCISFAFWSLFITNNYDLSMIMLVGGVCASRIGLWVFDISVTQLMQEFVPDGIRGIVGGTQHSFNAFFQLLSFALGLVFPNPRDFHIYVSAGYIAVAVAVLAFTFGIFNRQQLFFTDTERQRFQVVR